MTSWIESDVLIVGAGPVGLTIAMDLAGRGIEVTVLELRHRGEPPSVKCNHVSARSMEIFRRLGLSREVRDSGLPADFPHDVAFRTTMVGSELSRIPIPSRGRRYVAREGPDTWWPTPEPPHRINQIYLEPILFDRAVHTSGIMVHNRYRFEGLSQASSGVNASALNLHTGDVQQFRARFLIGCDGGRSDVRRQIGASLSGDAVIQRVQSTYFRAPGLLSMIQGPPSWGTMALNPRRSGTVYAIDGRETWLVHNYLRDEEIGFDSVDRDWAIRAILGVDEDFDYEVLSKEDWFGRRLLADRFRDHRVFLCGDSAHLWVPYAGYGMNAGLADAENLAWLLAAHLNGWGTESILNAYERERYPITEQVSHFAMNHAHEAAKQRRAVPREIEDDSPDGEAARGAVGRAAYELNVQQYCCAGLNFGYYYDDSPIIAYDGSRHPAYSMGNFASSTVPGCRTPHFFLADGGSLYDLHGPDYALLRLDPEIRIDPLVEAAARRGVPVRILDIKRDEAPAEYSTKLVLSRPDRHVAWRGDELPPDTLALVDLVRGVGSGWSWHEQLPVGERWRSRDSD